MRVLIAGGSGLIGRQLTTLLANSGDEVTILSRNPSQVRESPAIAGVLHWDGRTIGDWVKQVGKTDVIVNLTGENLSGNGFPPSRWTEKRKKLLLQSRIDSGEVLCKAIELAPSKPSIFVQASGIGFYGTDPTMTFTEQDQSGDDFLAKLSIQWEASSKAVEEFGIRRVITRNGIVLSTAGGALPSLLLPYKLYVGGRLGSGLQVYSWIHILDEARGIQYLIQDSTASGVYNMTTPNPMTNDEFGRAIGKVMHRPHYFPVPSFAMQLTLGEVALMVLNGQRVLPTRLMELGFKFKFPTLEGALSDLLDKRPG